MHHTATLIGVLLISPLLAGACGAGKPSPTAPSVATTPTAASAASLTISGFTSLSGKGESGTLSAFVTYSDGSVQDRTMLSRWSSANEAVATVNAAGVVTALSDGRTAVTATFNNVSASKTIVVDLP